MKKKVNEQAWDSLGSHLTAAQKLKSNVKKCHFNSTIFFFFFLQTIVHAVRAVQISSWKFFDKLQAPFKNVKGSQWDLVIPNINTKLLCTIQYNLILYGTPFKQAPQWKPTYPVFNHIWVI